MHTAINKTLASMVALSLSNPGLGFPNQLPTRLAFVLPDKGPLRLNPDEFLRLQSLKTQDDGLNSTNSNSFICKNTLLASVTLCGALLLGNPIVQPVSAYELSDYQTDTVVNAVREIQSAYGNADQTLKAYENVAAIITEGRGIGGMVNYKGVQLERGYVADEDTSIYNPGLTLLTESEKERLVEAIVQARKEGLSRSQWTQDTQLGYEFLKERLDPFHITELRGYLQIFPFYVGIIYLVVLAVQVLARPIFSAVYIMGAVAIFAPIAVLIALGP